MARKFVPGVYQIVNKVTGDCYVGSSGYVYDRCHDHWRNLRKNIHVNKHLQAAWNKYGEDAFECEVIEECSQDVLIEREQFWIDFHKPAYNKRKQAHSNLGLNGWKNTPETRLKKAQAATGRTHTTETKAKLSAMRQGKKQSEESNRKRSASLKANKRVWTEEQKAQIAAKNRETWAMKSAEEKRSYTQKRSPEVQEANRQRMAELGRKPEVHEASRIALARQAEERKQARKEKHYAFTQTPEHKEKMKESRQVSDAAGKAHGGAKPDPSKPRSRYHIRTEEERQAMHERRVQASTGRKDSPEVIQKKREAALKREAAKRERKQAN